MAAVTKFRRLPPVPTITPFVSINSGDGDPSSAADPRQPHRGGRGHRAPAAAVKELVENAIDAGASRIDVTLKEGGQGLIAVADNGGGMSADELALAVERHCTSKLPDDDLMLIAALGFRGGALPSIGAVSRMRIVSRPLGADNAWEIAVEAGRKSAPLPAAHPPGTRVEVRDLFFATPVRLKFLKTQRNERELAAPPCNGLPGDCVYRDRRRGAGAALSRKASRERLADRVE
jgi:hypothetical protein